MKTKDFGKLIGCHPIEVYAMRKNGKINSQTVLDLIYDTLSEFVLSGVYEKDIILELILLDRKQSNEYGSLSNHKEEKKHKEIQRALWVILHDDILAAVDKADTLEYFFDSRLDEGFLWESFYKGIIPHFEYEQRTQVYTKKKEKVSMLWKRDVETADTMESFNKTLGFVKEIHTESEDREFFETTFRNAFRKFLMKCKTVEEFFSVCKQSTINCDTLCRGDEAGRVYDEGIEAMQDVFDKKISEWISLDEIEKRGLCYGIKTLKALLDSARGTFVHCHFSVNTNSVVAAFSLKVFQEAYNQIQNVSVDEILELIEICSVENSHLGENDAAKIKYYEPFFVKQLQESLWQEIQNNQNNESMDSDRFNMLFRLANPLTKIKIMDKMIKD